jgi:hypothetical protein
MQRILLCVFPTGLHKIYQGLLCLPPEARESSVGEGVWQKVNLVQCLHSLFLSLGEQRFFCLVPDLLTRPEATPEKALETTEPKQADEKDGEEQDEQDNRDDVHDLA